MAMPLRMVWLVHVYLVFCAFFFHESMLCCLNHLAYLDLISGGHASINLENLNNP